MQITLTQLYSGRHTVFATAAAAEAMISAIDDDSLSYRVVLDPTGTGKAIVNVHDEDGNLIDTL